MKAFLLAAGKGTRLRPLTDAIPKCLVPIHGVPLLEIWIDLLVRHGIGKVLINTHHHAEQVEDFAKDLGKRYRIEIKTFFERELLGSAGTLSANQDFVAGSKDFLIAYADNLTDFDLSGMIGFHRAHRAEGAVLTMGLMRAADPRSCGIVSMGEDGKIMRFIEKPSNPESDLANAGIYVASPAFFGFFPGEGERKNGVLDIGYHLLPRLTGKMYGYPVEGYLRDIGTLSAYQKALEEWPKNAAPLSGR